MHKNSKTSNKIYVEKRSIIINSENTGKNEY